MKSAAMVLKRSKMNHEWLHSSVRLKQGGANSYPGRCASSCAIGGEGEEAATVIIIHEGGSQHVLYLEGCVLLATAVVQQLGLLQVEVSYLLHPLILLFLLDTIIPSWIEQVAEVLSSHVARTQALGLLSVFLLFLERSYTEISRQQTAARVSWVS